MNYAETFALRLKMARKMRSMTMEEVCAKTDGRISKQLLSRYECGKGMPGSSQTLLTLCRALGVKPDYLHKEYKPVLLNIHYQKSRRIGERELESIRYKVEDNVERTLETDSLFGAERRFTAPARMAVNSCDDAVACAKAVREVWRLGTAPIGSAYGALEERGAIIVEIDAPDSFSGLNAETVGNIPVIVVRKGMSAEEKRLTAFHELGHFLMDTSSMAENDEERACDTFASEMLMPSPEFVRVIGERRHDIAVVELSNLRARYGITVDALMTKARQLSVISEKRLRTYFKKKSITPSLKKEAERSVTPDEECRQLESMVFRALSSEMITESKAAVLLNWSTGDVHSKFALA